MEQEVFKQQLAALQGAVTPGSDERRQHVRQLHEVYTLYIQEIIVALNRSDEPQRAQLLQQIKAADQLYLEAQGSTITGHVLFSRHGKCSRLRQKKLGLSPNTVIEEDAQHHMAATNQASSNLLFYPEHKRPYIAISPMTRALQTASLVIPHGITDAEICIEPALTENSATPSGFDIRSKADLQKLYAETSFWQEPLKKILFKISIWLYHDKDFQALYEQRQSAALAINKHGTNIDTATDAQGRPDVYQNLDYKGDKIEDIKQLINAAGARDCWLFGHGKNFQTFFSHELGISSEFDYAETRPVYKIKTDKDASLFSPPYALIISQDSGLIEAKYTGTLATSLPQQSTAPMSSADSLNKLAKLDGRMPAPSQTMTQKTNIIELTVEPDLQAPNGDASLQRGPG